MKTFDNFAEEITDNISNIISYDFVGTHSFIIKDIDLAYQHDYLIQASSIFKGADVEILNDSTMIIELSKYEGIITLEFDNIDENSIYCGITREINWSASSEDEEEDDYD
jgi:hypothetical protein